MNLLNMPIVTIALSIIISWALFALFCSYLLETFVQVKAGRGRFMKKFLLQQLKDVPNGINWGSLLYMHGAVDLLSRTVNKPTSDIPPNLFAESIIEVVANSHAVSVLRSENPTVYYKNSTLNNFKIATLGLQKSDVVAFFSQAITSAELHAGSDENAVYQKLVKNIEAWYSTFGDRMTLWYKKHTKKKLFILGVCLAAIINVDSIELFMHFQSSPEARNAIISYYDKNKETLSSYANKLNNTVDTGALKKQATGENLNYDSLLNAANNIQQATIIKQAIAVASLKDSLKLDSLASSANLPIGWKNRSFINGELAITCNWLLIGLLKLAGLLLMGLAASMGAPFWFDLLKKLYTKPA